MTWRCTARSSSARSRSRGALPFAYPPCFLLLLAPFGLLSYPVAAFDWVLLTFAGYCAAMRRWAADHALAGFVLPAAAGERDHRPGRLPHRRLVRRRDGAAAEAAARRRPAARPAGGEAPARPGPAAGAAGGARMARARRRGRRLDRPRPPQPRFVRLGAVAGLARQCRPDRVDRQRRPRRLASHGQRLRRAAVRGPRRRTRFGLPMASSRWPRPARPA